MSNSARVSLLVGLCTALAACGDNTAMSSSDSAGTAITTAQPSTGDPGSGSESPTTSQVPTEGSASNSDSATNTSDATGTSDASTTADTNEGPKLDLGVPEGMGACGCEFSYVWVANAEEGTVSKIITVKPANCGVYGGIQGVA